MTDLMRLDRLEWALHIAVVVERRLRATNDPDERQSLRALRDWHFAQLPDDQIRHGEE
jgi:hypothetical protein